MTPPPLQDLWLTAHFKEQSLETLQSVTLGPPIAACSPLILDAAVAYAGALYTLSKSAIAEEHEDCMAYCASGLRTAADLIDTLLIDKEVLERVPFLIRRNAIKMAERCRTTLKDSLGCPVTPPEKLPPP